MSVLFLKIYQFYTQQLSLVLQNTWSSIQWIQYEFPRLMFSYHYDYQISLILLIQQPKLSHTPLYIDVTVRILRIDIEQSIKSDGFW